MRKELMKKLEQKVSLPVIMAPMFLVSSPRMVIEGCKSGIIGSFPLLNARTAETLKEWMEAITLELEEAERQNPGQVIAPWAVNFIAHRSNKRYDEDLELIKEYKPPIVITSLGDPSPVAETVHQYGGLVFADVITVSHAKKAAARGVDGLILVCTGAGGHAGTINPFAFVGAVKEFWNGITILSGAISNGRDIMAAQALGADFAYMGTRFIPAEESFAQTEYRDMLIDSTLDDLIYTSAFSGVKANYLKPSIRQAGLDPDQLEKKEQADFSKMNEEGPKVWKNIWSAGQGVHTIHSVQTVSQIVDELKDSYNEARQMLISEKV
ncbi:NAD(P)H-dependent flavin oxidoreductase [Pseudobacillus badius]|uniref:NAD(P)H-dependent flavin oxidoreductase n=1 Tax=Bacillus badius TaxID=1455 RepID=UPI0009ECF29D|nr:nitronate monooxygenase [Bacillus badius]OVE51747.1 2-nitropropane dioxygenase [Bacillus badius]TDW03164.1 nitronate monooxygenase [Bacillus badius]